MKCPCDETAKRYEDAAYGVTHESALNFILAHCCGALGEDEMEDGVQVYNISLCCDWVTVRARRISEEGAEPRYEIVSVER